jgi:hypothetical protein
MTLLCSVKRDGILQKPVELAGDVALEASPDLAVTLAFLDPPLHVGPRGRVMAKPAHDDGVKRPVQLAIAIAI